MKSAYVIPHLKKRGLDANDSKNFRPVSNLPFLSKLLERVVSTQLNDYLKVTGTLPSTQSAYRKFHSTETALLKVFSDLCQAIDDGNTCLLGLLDLSAAFDTVDHNILLNRLDLSFGVKGSVLQWFNSYLSDRTQTVQVAGCSSAKSILKSGVPQGSILGPLLFIMYTSPVTDIIRRHGLLSHCYADDTQLYFYCSPDQLDGQLLKLSNCVAELDHWMASNRLKLNCDKTEFIWIASRNKLETLHNSLPLVNIGSEVISPVTGARNLGVFFDSNLNFKRHITNVCRSSYYSLRQIRVIRRSLQRDVTKTLLHAFVSSRLDYCNSLFYGLPKCDIHRLQSVQNSAARIYGGLRKYDHITPVMRDQLHWLPINERIRYKIAVLTYMSIHQLAPDYLTAMCRRTIDNIALSRNRSASNGDLIPTSFKTVTYGKRSFYFSAPVVWNQLPVSVRMLTFDAFCKQLKTLLFKEIYKF